MTNEELYDILYTRSQKRLQEYAYALHKVQHAQHIKARRSPRAYSFTPDKFMRDWIEALGAGDCDRMKGFLTAPDLHPDYNRKLSLP